jgi:phosphonate transport system substrate-binding protein
MRDIPKVKISGCFSIIFIVSLFISSCNSKSNSSEDFPEKLVIGFSINDDPSGTIEYRRLIANYLQKELKLKKVDLFYTIDYAPIIEAMKANKVDIAYLGELAYVLAHEKAGVEAMVRNGLPTGNVPTYSVIITYLGSGINSIKDVISRSKDLTLLFSSPSSTSGHLYPREYLTRIGLDPETSFKQVSFSSGHTVAIFSIKSHKVDLACTEQHSLDRLIAKGKLNKCDFKILWTSDAYPGSPVTIRKNILPTFKQRIKQALLDWPLKDPKSWNEYKSKAMLFYPKEIRDKIIYIEAGDSVYNSIRKVIKNTKNFSFGLN